MAADAKIVTTGARSRAKQSVAVRGSVANASRVDGVVGRTRGRGNRDEREEDCYKPRQIRYNN